MICTCVIREDPVFMHLPITQFARYNNDVAGSTLFSDESDVVIGIIH